MSEIKVNKISPRTACGTTTLGDSGDSFVIPSGVTITNNGTQTGFGREGSVDWQTTIKTGDFTAVSGEGYFINTTSGEITMTLPSSPSAGAIVAIKDYANTFDTNKLTIARNGQPISGDAQDAEIVTEGQALTLVYGDATKGWQSVAAATESDLPKPGFITATGGTITTVCTNFKVHTFTGPGTFQVTCAGNPAGANTVSYLVIGGGGGTGRSYGGGAGAGGFRESKAASDSYTASPLNATSGPTYNLPVSVQSYPIIVGGGGTKASPPAAATNGVNSSFSTITSAGGGAGGHFTPNSAPGKAGGSGGGAADGAFSGGAGNTPPVSPPQGQPGGSSTPPGAAAGGGGAAAAGGNTGSPMVGGTGGAGVASSITGSPVTRAGGGGGFGQGTIGPGGTGGGGAGAPAGTAGTANTGGGAGGAGPTPNCSTNGTGGSGIVIIRYKFQ